MLSVGCAIAFPNLPQSTSSNNVMHCERTRGDFCSCSASRCSFVEWITALHLELLFIGMQVHLQTTFRSIIVSKWGLYCSVDDKKAGRQYFNVCTVYSSCFSCLRQSELFYRLIVFCLKMIWSWVWPLGSFKLKGQVEHQLSWSHNVAWRPLSWLVHRHRFYSYHCLPQRCLSW